MRIAITGGTGFLAGRLVEHLLNKGHEIFVITRRHDPAYTSIKVKQFVIDWNNQESFKGILKKTEVVIHAAGMSSQACELHPVSADKFNGAKTAELANLSAKFGAKKFIYLSTAQVYNSSVDEFHTEVSTNMNPSAYATSHKVGEDGVLAITNKYRMQRIVLRVGNVFGAPANSNENWINLAINDFYIQAVKTGQIVINSNSLSTRNFISALDFCSIVSQLIELETVFESLLLNVGAGTSQSLLTMAQRIARDVQDRTGQIVKIIETAESTSIPTTINLELAKLRSLNLELGDETEKEFAGIFHHIHRASNSHE